MQPGLLCFLSSTKRGLRQKAMNLLSSPSRRPLVIAGVISVTRAFTRRLGVVGCSACILLTSCGDDRCSSAPVVTSARCDYTSEYDQPPILVSLSPPIYPEEARRNGEEGVVHVLIGVGTDSLPCGVRILSSDAASLEVASLQSALTTKWIPATRGGRVVAAEVDAPFRFSLLAANGNSGSCDLQVVRGTK